jgi:hypothetical protein
MVDPQSATWEAVSAAIGDSLATARRRLETPGLPAPETEHERGRIAALRHILALAEPRDIIPVESPAYL